MYVALETVQHEPHCHQMAAGIGSAAETLERIMLVEMIKVRK